MTRLTYPPHIRELARYLDIEASTVLRYVRRNHLKIDRSEGCCFLVDPIEVSELIQYYEGPGQGSMALTYLAKDLTVPVNSLHRYVKRHDLPIRKIKGRVMVEDPLALADIQLYYANDRQRDEAFLEFLKQPQSRWVFFDQSIYVSMEHLSTQLSPHPFDYIRKASDAVRLESGLDPLKGIEREVVNYDLKAFKEAWYRKYDEWPFPYSRRMVLGDIVKAFSYYKFSTDLVESSIDGAPEINPMSELALQALICEFSSYTPRPFSQEQSLLDHFTDCSTRRIDFQRIDPLTKKGVFYELKTPKLKLSHLKHKLNEARYLEVIQENYPGHEIELIFVAPAAEPEVLEMLTQYPSVRFLTVLELFQQIEQELIDSTPKEARMHLIRITSRFKTLLF